MGLLLAAYVQAEACCSASRPRFLSSMCIVGAAMSTSTRHSAGREEEEEVEEEEEEEEQEIEREG